MGLEIYYDIHAPVVWDAQRTRETVEAARRFALTLDFLEVDKVEANDPEEPQRLTIRRVPRGYRHGWPSALANGGWYFRTWPGKRCETALFGLCRFPKSVERAGQSLALGWGPGWHYHSCCKTQYADLVSRDHFLKCHLGIIAILDFFRECGCRVAARDGGDYWRSRNENILIKRLEEMHAMVAAFAGAFKDVAEGHGHIIAPITQKADFEHLEAKGREIFRRNRLRKKSKKSQ